MPSKAELLIGPEGGLDDDELHAAQKAGFMPVRLGPRVLRTETAAVVALSVLQGCGAICSNENNERRSSDGWDALSHGPRRTARSPRGGRPRAPRTHRRRLVGSKGPWPARFRRRGPPFRHRARPGAWHSSPGTTMMSPAVATRPSIAKLPEEPPPRLTPVPQASRGATQATLLRGALGRPTSPR